MVSSNSGNISNAGGDDSQSSSFRSRVAGANKSSNEAEQPSKYHFCLFYFWSGSYPPERNLWRECWDHYGFTIRKPEKIRHSQWCFASNITDYFSCDSFYTSSIDHCTGWLCLHYNYHSHLCDLNTDNCNFFKCNCYKWYDWSRRSLLYHQSVSRERNWRCIRSFILSWN